jgi:hypothetical protein
MATTLAIAALVAHASAFAPHQVTVLLPHSAPCGVPVLRPRVCGRALAGGWGARRRTGTGEGVETLGRGGSLRAGRSFGRVGPRMAAVKEASAEVVINAPMEEIWAVWSNFELMPRWQVCA